MVPRTRPRPPRRPGVGVRMFGSLLGLLGLLGPVVLAGCSSSSPSAGGTPSTGGLARSPGVGVLTDTFVDPSRPTAAWGPNPARPSRTLVTTIYYPASRRGARPQAGAPADRSHAPYPLIVFAHGLGASPGDYRALLAQWSSAGFVVAAPRFPLSSDETPGGPDGGDIAQQPGDMSEVITFVLQESATGSGPLAGMVDPGEVGAAGHSNGAITTLGLVANTCCHDARVKAAVIMAGTTEGFPSGTYDFSVAPPLLVVHGTGDQLVPYRSGVSVFDRALGPKGLLTVRGGSHESAAGLVAGSSRAVMATTVAFFEDYLAHDQAAARRLAVQTGDGDTALVFDPAVGSRATVPVPAAPVVHLQASVTPDRGLVDGQAVTVRWHGYTPGKVVNVLECSKLDLSTASSAGCDFTNAKILHPDPTGSGSLVFRVATGAVGNGTCDAAHPGCSIIVNNSSSTDPAESRQVPIGFAP